jgi:hypothetical protein
LIDFTWHCVDISCRSPDSVERRGPPSRYQSWKLDVVQKKRSTDRRLK